MGRSKRKLDIKTDLAVFKAVKKQFGGIKKNSSFKLRLRKRNIARDSLLGRVLIRDALQF